MTLWGCQLGSCLLQPPQSLEWSQRQSLCLPQMLLLRKSNPHTFRLKMINCGTGAQQVKVSAGVSTTTLRTVEIVKVDPYDEGGTGAGSGLRKCLVHILKTPYTNIAAT